MWLMLLKPQLTYTECNVGQERTNEPWVSHVGQLDNTGRHVEAGLGRDVEPYPTLTAIHAYSTY